MMRIISILTVALLLIGCSQRPTPAPQPTFAVFDAPIVVTATIEGVPSPNVTVTPTLAAPESLSMDEALARLDPFSDADCELPCYNGLIMGSSTHNEVYNFFARIGIGLHDLIPGDFEEFRHDGTGRLGAWLTRTRDAAAIEQQDITPPLVSVYMVNNTADATFVSWSTYPDYLSVSNILTQLGEPASTRLGMVFSETPVTYLLELTYPSRQTSIIIYGDAIGDSSKQQVCFNADQVYAVSMGVFKPADTPIQQISYVEYLLPLAETLGIAYTDFAAAMSSTGCFDVPASSWSAWQSIEQ